MKNTCRIFSSIVIVLLFVCASVISGQVKRNSVTSIYAGYAYWNDSFEKEFADTSYHGLRLSLELKWNADSPVGFIVDFGNFKQDRSFGNDRWLNTYMAGIRYVMNRGRFIEPFLQPLFGIAYIGRFGFDLGGGIDVNAFVDEGAQCL